MSETRETLNMQARELVSAYYAHHSEYGEQPCPCEVCEKARVYFAALLTHVDAVSETRETPFSHAATLGQLRELTFDLPDDTPIAVATRKAHDPDHFYEIALAEAEAHVDLTQRPVVIITAPEPRDFGG